MIKVLRRVAVFVVAVGLLVQPIAPLVGPPPAVAVTAGSRPASPMCGVANLAAVTAPTRRVPTTAVQRIAGGFAVGFLTVAPDQIVTADGDDAGTIRRFSLDGTPLNSFSTGFRASAPHVVVDPAGDLYVARYPDTLVKLNASGGVIWSKPKAAVREIDALFALGSGASFRIGVVGRGETDSAMYDASGSSAGRSPIRGATFSPTADGGLLATDATYVRQYDSAGRQTLVFGDRHVGNDPSPSGGPLHFYQQGGAVRGSDGKIFVADATRGIHATNSQGLYVGLAPDATLGHLTQRSFLALSGKWLYFAAGGRFNANQHVARISVSDLKALVAAPKPPAPVLGFGAGILTSATGNYFRPGRAPAVRATFDPWWARLAPGLRLSYTVRDRNQVIAGKTVAARTIALPTTASALARIPLTLPKRRPGAYEVEARLLSRSGATRAATCLHYTVGAPGQRLDFTTLPPGTDHGGPAPARGIALAEQLGTGGMRGRVQWSRLLPDPAGPMDFSAYDAAFAAGAKESAARRIPFWVQVGEGSATEKALVANGTWEARVRELVAHFKGSVHIWEAWNEPNATFGPPESYVTQVLAPFSRAVRAAHPGAKVIGASVVGVDDLAYFDRIGKSGGYSMMDIIGIHPYPGHNRSWEEHGTPGAISRLKRVLKSHGAGGKPIWNTESAWWSNGPGNYLAQGDKLARAMVWSRILGIARWNYFLIEGAFGDWGVSFSLIEAAAQVDEVKPAALASMTASSQLRGRRFVGWLSTGIPSAYAARFGPRKGGTDQLVVLWTSDLNVTGTVAARGATTSVRARVTDVVGHSRNVALGSTPRKMRLSGSPLYVVVPKTAALRIRPSQTFGSNRASATSGASATASSSLATNPAAAAIDGKNGAALGGDLPAIPAWASAPGDAAPTLTVKLVRATRVNRILVSTHSVGSIVPGLRDYDLAVRSTAGTWTTVARVRGEFFAHRRLVTFKTRKAAAVRLVARRVNASGSAGGLAPWYWPTDAASLRDPTKPWFRPAVVEEIAVYSPGRAR